MKKNILPIFIGLILIISTSNFNTLFSNNQNDSHITGHVVDSQTGEHLPYINIALKGTTIATLTDESGHFFIKNVPVGKYNLLVSSIGYKSLDTLINVLPNTTLDVKLAIKEEAFSVDEVVVSATKNETNNRQSPTMVKVISTKHFETNAASNITETINFNCGLRSDNSCSNCGATELKINGLEGKYSQILLDNRPIFSSLASVYGLEQLPVSMIERIEIVKGGGSALFGSSSIGGVVNIITKEPLANTLSVSNTTSITAKGNMDINTSLNGSFVSADNKSGLYLFGMLKNRDGYDHNNDGFTDSPKLESQTMGFRGYYKTSMYSKLTLEYHHIGEYRRGGDLISLPPHQANIAEQLRHSIDGGGLRFDSYSNNQKHRFQLYLSMQKIKRESYFGVEKDTNAYGNTKDITAVTGTQYTYCLDNFLISPANLTIGGEFSHNTLKDRFLGFNRNLQQYTNVAGVFLQSEWKTARYNLVLGARLDKHNKINKVIISPRVSFRYGIAPWVDFRCGYSSGYLAPQAYNEDLHVNAVGGEMALIELSKNLKPEYSNSATISTDMYFNIGKLQCNIITEGFYTSIKDIFTLRKDRIDASGNIIYVRENSFGAKIFGGNIDVKLGIPKIFDIQLGYTLQNSTYNKPFEWSKDIAPQRKMFRSPNQYGYITSNINLHKQLSLSLFMTYTGEMLVQHNAGYIQKDKELLTPDFIDAGFKFSYNFNISKVIKGTLFTGIKNVFNSYQQDIDYGKLKDASYIYGPSEPRRYFIGMKFMF